MRIALLLVLCLQSTFALAKDFELSRDGVGPFEVSMKIEIRARHDDLDIYPKKAAEVIITALNDSGMPIRYASLCVRSMWRTKGCDFHLWTDQIWAPGEELTWNARGSAPRGIENALIVMDKIRVAPPPDRESDTPPGADPRLQSVRKIYVAPLDGDNGANAREQIVSLLTNSGRFVTVGDPKLADGIMKGFAESSIPKITPFSQVGIYGLVDTKPTGQDSLILHVELPSGAILWAWDDTKNCRQSKPKCAVTDLSRQ